ncbi:2662_t:CDS:2 [Funneliformis geosporum]|uniref:2662_t:CDS:1 n=1 Tax=Funneliformis geosporum TaxID=1117311 RepID=A0A9W4SEE4_9GLOM|nr:2662_t:CDS:2 [Funneliformis geosporum]
MVRAKKYDTEGNYTEEYQRIRLIRYLLQKKGYPKSYFIIEYAIPIGHKGHNTLRVDLVIKKANQFICVAEVKKGYSEQNRKSAIKHQLIPAMRIVNAKYGIYFDGTPKIVVVLLAAGLGFFFWQKNSSGSSSAVQNEEDSDIHGKFKSNGYIDPESGYSTFKPLFSPNMSETEARAEFIEAI